MKQQFQVSEILNDWVCVKNNYYLSLTSQGRLVWLPPGPNLLCFGSAVAAINYACDNLSDELLGKYKAMPVTQTQMGMEYLKSIKDIPLEALVSSS